MPYIGELEVGTVARIGETDDATVTFAEGTDHPPVTLSVALLGDVTSEEKGKGNVTDCVNHHFAKSFLSQLALAGIKTYSIEGVAMGMRTLAHNLREVAIGKAFNCHGGDDILIGDLIPKEDGETEK